MLVKQPARKCISGSLVSCNWLRSVIWQRLRNYELVIQSKSLGMREGKEEAILALLYFEVSLQGCM